MARDSGCEIVSNFEERIPGKPRKSHQKKRFPGIGCVHMHGGSLQGAASEYGEHCLVCDGL
uniref:Cellulose synthase-like protein G3 n=1 Tax=Rhizophora mucronata TaxID=61149 RepID=A0A2P2JW59_RHIMU